MTLHILPVPPAAGTEPGWAMGPSNGAGAGIDARGSWLLEPDTATGMLLYPRDWSFAERRDVVQHLRSQGWAVVPARRFLHVTGDGKTVIRLLADFSEPAEHNGGELHEFPAAAAQSG